MGDAFADIRFDPVAIYGSTATLVDGVSMYAGTVAIRGLDRLTDADRAWFDRWVDYTFAGHGPIEESSSYGDHDCPTCSCVDERAEFRVRLPAPDRRAVERALRAVRVPPRYEGWAA
jgi:hypothetical protein